MASVPESVEWTDSVYQIETTDPVMGGVGGIANLQAKALANRTQYLRSLVETRLPAGSLLCVVGATAALPGTVVADGSLISRSGSAAALWTFVEAHCRLVSEAAWVASDWGTYSTGDGASTFRLPRLTDEFLRYVGGTSTRLVGSRQLGSPIVGEDGVGYTLWGVILGGQKPAMYDAPSDAYSSLVALWDTPNSITTMGYPSSSSNVGIARPRNVAVLPLISLGA